MRPLPTGERELYLPLEAGPVFGILHGPAGAEHSRVGVLVCPPFGWDELCTHRTIRLWAQLCAGAGHPTLRIDFPGCGDSSGSPRDPKRLEAWTAAAAAGARLLRERESCQRVVAMGIGLGGMVACRALSEGALIDDLILWSVARNGSLLLRELRAFAGIVAGDATAPDNGAISAAPDDGALAVAGFVMTAETLADLEQLDLATLPIGDGDKRRVLLLGRDTLAPDRRLREHLEASGATVTVGDGSGSHYAVLFMSGTQTLRDLVTAEATPVEDAVEMLPCLRASSRNADDKVLEQLRKGHPSPLRARAAELMDQADPRL